jgi:hypothetical protein
VDYEFIFYAFGSNLIARASPLYPRPTSGVDTNFVSGSLAFMAWSSTAETVEYDDVFVRKYVSPEPTHGAWGFEESLPNDPPDIPSVPSGPNAGYQNVSYGYNSSASDPDADQVKIKFDWGDGQQSESGLVPSGQTVQLWHTWASTDDKCIKAKAIDEHGATSDWSTCQTLAITNRAPETPSTPIGPSSGYHNVSYGFNSSATDPDNNTV